MFSLSNRPCSKVLSSCRKSVTTSLGSSLQMRVADLVDDSDAAQRTKVLTALKDPAQKNNRDHVDIIIALGMAKEGFDWIWCEHALTVGYRSSLTVIVQIIGRATRDAQGRTTSRFTNLIAEPAAEASLVTEAVNDMLKAISASLLMEQVLAPRYEFTGSAASWDEGGHGHDRGSQPSLVHPARPRTRCAGWGLGAGQHLPGARAPDGMSAPAAGAKRLFGAEKGEIRLEMTRFAHHISHRAINTNLALNSAACSA